ncbi:hypothetical protein RISK_004429 [Rhodopirellula islandica]|uniref:Uncharacterized protein n=1 Tax=Rhodopirellula islandica TaxID=595434 RepID=A0A0J1B9X8_RHOIS|nr:hypothetical protein RISK_004429 [Rhodopirellula islandica]
MKKTTTLRCKQVPSGGVFGQAVWCESCSGKFACVAKSLPDGRRKASFIRPAQTGIATTGPVTKAVCVRTQVGRIKPLRQVRCLLSDA